MTATMISRAALAPSFVATTSTYKSTAYCAQFGSSSAKLGVPSALRECNLILKAGVVASAEGWQVNASGKAVATPAELVLDNPVVESDLVSVAW